MPIHYICRYCQQKLGHVPQDPEITEQRLGFDTLTDEERSSIINIEENGDVKANVICEHCQEAIDRHPELLLYPSIHQ